eukprot:TRINITY_DN12609_c0_g1_i1.p1 TRINITY_DN12609_c0_g1~~TRINITY_DN12609_c0_g1_i1.p1  ORF type:complete len:332 (-),score=67.68 TRINITY_DN12609_c0_g1_i1:18-1013(-)
MSKVKVPSLSFPMKNVGGTGASQSARVVGTKEVVVAKAKTTLWEDEGTDSDLETDSDYTDSEEEEIEFTITPRELQRKSGQILSNSTSSLYIHSSINNPNVSDVNTAIAVVLRQTLINNHKKSEVATLTTNDEDSDQSHEPEIYAIFNEEIHPLSHSFHNNALPTANQITGTLDRIFLHNHLPVEISILTLAYVERLLSISSFTLNTTNYRRVLLAAVVLACKVWEDQAIFNRDFVPMFAFLKVKDVHQLEKAFLKLLNYEVEVTGAVYAKYYFELRKIAIVNKTEWNLKPLTKEKAKALTASSKKQGDLYKGRKRSCSLDTFDGPVLLSK